MRKNWYSALDVISLPLVMLMAGMVLMSIGRIETTNETLGTIINCLVYTGDLLVNLFPLAVVINYTGKKYEDSIVVIVSIICYLVLNVVTMFLNDAQFASYFYKAVMGLSYSSTTSTVTITKMPINTGLFGSVLVALIILFVYKYSRRRYNYGVLSFITNDVCFFIISVFLTVCAAVAITYLSPTLFRLVQRTINFISRNSTNPASLFIYGICDKLCAVTGLHNIIEDSLWLGELGGSYIDASGNTILGDINIWTAQMEAGTLTSGTGKYLTEYYLNNIFIIPSILIGLYIHTSDKIERRRALGVYIIALIVSLVCGSAVPIELILLIVAPTLFGIHVVLSGVLSMVLGMLDVSLGTVLTDSVTTSSVGNIIDFIHYANELLTRDSVVTIAIVGAVCFVVYQILVDLYYRHLSYFFLEKKKGRKEYMEIVHDLGGLSNIKMVTATPYKIIFVVADKSKINSNALINTTVYKVTERYFGFVLEYGPGSFALRKKIKKEIRNYEDCLKYHTGV